MGDDLVCRVVSEPDKLGIGWSVGSSCFESYTLTGRGLRRFNDLAVAARAQLSDLADDYLNGSPEELRRSSLEVARVGHDLYQQLFQPAPGIQELLAGQVRAWLADMRERGAIESLEVVMVGPVSPVPWNVLYEAPPSEEVFLAEPGDPARWEPFWGVRYNLACGRPVEPLRRVWMRKPRLLMVIDPMTRGLLPADQQQALAVFLDARGLKAVESRPALVEALKGGRPEILYWLSHAEPKALYLADEPVTPDDLYDLLRGGGSGPVGGLAFLNACRTAESAETGSFLEALGEVGLSGVIATEHQTVDTFAVPFGLEFLGRFLDGEPLGAVLQGLRSRGVPLGLLYGAYCPPGLRVVKEGAAAGPGLVVAEAPRLAGTALGPRTVRGPVPEGGRRRAAAPAAGAPVSLARRVRPPPPRAVRRPRRRRAAVRPRARRPPHTRRATARRERRGQVVVPPRGGDPVSGGRVHRLPRPARASGRGDGAEGGDDASASLVFVRATGDLAGQLAQALCAASAPGAALPARRGHGTGRPPRRARPGARRPAGEPGGAPRGVLRGTRAACRVAHRPGRRPARRAGRGRRPGRGGLHPGARRRSSGRAPRRWRCSAWPRRRPATSSSSCRCAPSTWAGWSTTSAAARATSAGCASTC